MIESEVRKSMDQVMEMVISDISSIRTGRATPALVEDVVVAAYGGTQKLKIMELASISATDAQTLVISPWDKSIVGEIRKGILAANIGLTPSIDGDVIRISLPPLTTEDREKYVKLLSQKLEAGKVMIRQVRGEAMKNIKRAFEDKEIAEDEKFGKEETLQSITDEYNEKIDEMGKKKESELLG